MILCLDRDEHEEKYKDKSVNMKKHLLLFKIWI